MEKSSIIVTGIGGNVGQGVLRNIRDLNLNVFLIGTDIESVTSGNHLCDLSIKVPYSYEENYIDVVNKIVSKYSVKLIIPTTDYEVYYLSLNQAKIKAKILASDSKITKIYLDKYLSYKHHEEFGIPFAKTWLPSEYQNKELDIIVKPREGRGSRDIYLNPKNPNSFSDKYVIQPLYKGKEITTAFYVTKTGSLHGFFTLERELQNGTTVKSKTTREFDNKLKNIIDKMIEHSGFLGSLNLQSIVNEQGNIIPFEVNCRISGTNSIRHNLGFQDIKYALQEYLLNEKIDVVNIIDGVALRILHDVIYTGINDYQEVNSKTQFKIY